MTAPHGPGRDSAGTPWHDRRLTSTGFDTDTGEADAALRGALERPSGDRALMAAVAVSRLLVPVVAEPAQTGTGEHGLTEDKQVDMAVVTLVAPDGSRALPVFTSLADLAAWDPAARPVPVTAARAAQAAVAEGCEAVVVDVGSEHVRTLRPSMVWALAQQRAWQPAHEDPFVAASVASAAGGEPDVTAYELSDGEPAGSGTLRVVLTLRPGLAAESVRDLATRIGEALAADGEFRARCDGLAFVIR